MKTWMLPWLFPFGLVGAIVFVVVTSPYEALAAPVVGLVLVPVLWRQRFGRAGEDTNYWRIKRP
jgi:hypothetical protein